MHFTEPKGPQKVRRFSKYRILEHWFHIFAFLALVVTGLSQKYHSYELSQMIILQLGGIDNTRYVHRFVGAVFFLFSFAHIFGAVIGVTLRRWHPSMLITKKDFLDLSHNIRYYLGQKARPARCGRYDYKQKFEYWAILLGVVVMIVSGFVLWFPMQATSCLPGEVVPVAKALHSNGALVIVLIVALWHIYNAIFSPEVFPLDRSIFTGYISSVRMRKEHPLELDEAGIKHDGAKIELEKEMAETT